MKKIIWLFPVILFFLTGCYGNGHREHGPFQEKDSAVESHNYDSIVSVQEHAIEDSGYRKSEAYRYAQETWHRHIAEQTVGMNHADQVLYEYEIAVHSVNRAGRYAVQHPDKMKSRKMQNLMSIRGEEAVRLHDQLLRMKLSIAQQRKFDMLNHSVN